MNICGGDCLKELLEKQTGQKMIAFREAMSEGPLTEDVFCANFISERANFHKSSQREYKKHMQDYLSAYKKIKNGEEVCLWFGQDLFCQINMLVVLAHLEEAKKLKSATINIVDENNGKLIRAQIVDLNGFVKAYKSLCENKTAKTNVDSINSAVKTYIEKKTN